MTQQRGSARLGRPVVGAPMRLGGLGGSPGSASDAVMLG